MNDKTDSELRTEAEKWLNDIIKNFKEAQEVIGDKTSK